MLSFGHSNFFCFKDHSMVRKTPIQTTISMAVMTEPKILIPSLSKISPMTSVAVT